MYFLFPLGGTLSLQRTWQLVIYSLSLWHAQHQWRGCVFSKICIHNKTAAAAKRQRRMICESREIFFFILYFFFLGRHFSSSLNWSTYILYINIYIYISPLPQTLIRVTISADDFFLCKGPTRPSIKSGTFLATT